MVTLEFVVVAVGHRSADNCSSAVIVHYWRDLPTSTALGLCERTAHFWPSDPFEGTVSQVFNDKKVSEK